MRWIVIAGIVVVLAVGFAWDPVQPSDTQTLAAATKPGYRTDGWPEQLRARTLRQGESNRIY